MRRRAREHETHLSRSSFSSVQAVRGTSKLVTEENEKD
jgi:hypothetical protein